MNLFKVVVSGVLTVAMLGSTSNSQVADKSLVEPGMHEVELSATVDTLSHQLGEFVPEEDSPAVAVLARTDLLVEDVDVEYVCCMSGIGCYQTELGCYPGDYMVSCPCRPNN